MGVEEGARSVHYSKLQLKMPTKRQIYIRNTSIYFNKFMKVSHWVYSSELLHNPKLKAALRWERQTNASTSYQQNKFCLVIFEVLKNHDGRRFGPIALLFYKMI